jgi:hypothetical protein
MAPACIVHTQEQGPVPRSLWLYGPTCVCKKCSDSLTQPALLGHHSPE